MSSEDFLNSEERIAVREVCRHGARWGFGNMIDRLRAGWAVALMEDPLMKDWPLSNHLRAAGFDEGRILRCVRLSREELIASLREYCGGA